MNVRAVKGDPWLRPRGSGKSRGRMELVGLGRASAVMAMKAVARISAIIVRRRNDSSNAEVLCADVEGVCLVAFSLNDLDGLCLVAFSCNEVEGLCLVS